jgi:hypothetical protein
MKNFLDLLDTEQHLTVSINNTVIACGLHDHLVFNVNDAVTVDSIEILPKYQYLTIDGKLTISEPFYRWYHQVSGQGWLLMPQ